LIVEDASRFARDLVTQELGILSLIQRGVRVLTASGAAKALNGGRSLAEISKGLAANGFCTRKGKAWNRPLFRHLNHTCHEGIASICDISATTAGRHLR